MKHLIAAGLMLAAGAALGDQIAFTSDGITLLLTSEPCSNKDILATLNPKFKFKRAVESGTPRTFEACWIMEDNVVYVRYDDGESNALPVTAFKRSPGV